MQVNPKQCTSMRINADKSKFASNATNMIHSGSVPNKLNLMKPINGKGAGIYGKQVQPTVGRDEHHWESKQIIEKQLQASGFICVFDDVLDVVWATLRHPYTFWPGSDIINFQETSNVKTSDADNFPPELKSGLFLFRWKGSFANVCRPMVNQCKCYWRVWQSMETMKRNEHLWID